MATARGRPALLSSDQRRSSSQHTPMPRLNAPQAFRPPITLASECASSDHRPSRRAVQSALRFRVPWYPLHRSTLAGTKSTTSTTPGPQGAVPPFTATASASRCRRRHRPQLSGGHGEPGHGAVPLGRGPGAAGRSAERAAGGPAASAPPDAQHPVLPAGERLRLRWRRRRRFAALLFLLPAWRCGQQAKSLPHPPPHFTV